jgi:polycystin 1L2
MTQVNGFMGFVGYGIRELSQNETNSYCSNKSSFNIFPKIEPEVNFTSDLMIRSYTSGCYYFDTNTGKWYSNGMDVYEDTNLEKTHCLSDHLTSFAGGLVILPSTINFQYAFVRNLLSKSFLVEIFIIILTCIYILFAIWSRYRDIQDEKKMNLVLLNDNNPSDIYFYEVIAFTGTKIESGIKSKVIRFLLLSAVLSSHQSRDLT